MKSILSSMLQATVLVGVCALLFAMLFFPITMIALWNHPIAGGIWLGMDMWLMAVAIVHSFR